MHLEIDDRSARRWQVASLRWPACAALIATAILLDAGWSRAAKWSGCPADPKPVYVSSLGAANAPFVHPGHELRIMLNEAQVASSGGFAIAEPGNRVEIEFATLFGDGVTVAPRQVVAASASLLILVFPDTAAELGRPFTGPVGISVKRGEQVVARIDPADLVALPPASDVTALLSGEDPQQIIYAALGANGDLWVPARFHGKSMPMPGCPGDLMMPMAIEVGAASIPGLTVRRRGPLDRIRRLALYFADVAIDGNSFYGALSPQRIPLVHLGGTRGVAICRMNDALDIVLRVKGSKAWARARRSPLAEVVRDAAAIPLQLHAAQTMPEKAAAPWDQADSFGSTCEPTPTIEVGAHGGALQSSSQQP